MADLINRVSSNDGSHAYTKQPRQSVTTLKEEPNFAENEVERERDARDIKIKQVTSKPAVEISLRALAYCRRHSMADTSFGMTSSGLCKSGQRVTSGLNARLSIRQSHLRRHWDQSPIRLFVDV